MNLNNQYLNTAKNYLQSMQSTNGLDYAKFKEQYKSLNLGGDEGAAYSFNVLDTNKSGTLDAHEVASLLKQADRNKDGSVNFVEAQQAYLLIQNNLFAVDQYKQDALKFAAVNQAQNWLGAVNNGQAVTKEQFENIYTSAGLGSVDDAKATSNYLDLDGDGRLGETEIATVFYTADTNKSGSVDGNEARAFYSRIRSAQDQASLLPTMRQNYQLLYGWQSYDFVNLNNPKS